jgi:hypothetical protein
MKKSQFISLAALLVMVCIAVCFGMTYDSTYYQQNRSWAGSGNTNLDPIYLNMQEVEDYIEANKGTGVWFYVDSGATGQANGTSWTDAVVTLDAAVALCTANRGDVIWVAQGHAENLTGADGVDIDIPGVTAIGLGKGDLRPTFSYTNAAGEFVLGAAGDNSSIRNFRFIATVDSVVKAIDVEAACVGWSIIGCEFSAETTTTDEYDDVIMVGAAADKGWIDRCRFLGDPGSNGDPQSCINFVDSDYLRITNCEAFGDRAVACIQNETTASNHILIENNTLFNGIIGGNAGLNGQPCIELVATTTGVIQDNYIVCNLATKAAAVVGADMYLFENYYNEDEGGGATGGIIGTASADD